MEITKVTPTEHRRYIPLKGIGSVEQALNLFADGVTTGSRATQNNLIQAVGEGKDGGLAVGFLMLATAGVSGNKFVKDQIMSTAPKALKDHGRWHGDWDYGAMGTSFFKSSVDIEVLDRDADLFALGIHAAYVGDKPEAGLADHLGVERALIWASVEVETRPVNDGFEFDFEAILRKLDTALPVGAISGVQVADQMMTADEYGNSRATFTLHSDEDVVVTLGPGAVGHRFDYPERGKSVDTWSIEEALLRGNLRESYEKEGEFAPPTFVISLRGAKGDRYNSATIYQPELKASMLKLRDEIASAIGQ